MSWHVCHQKVSTSTTTTTKKLNLRNGNCVHQASPKVHSQTPKNKWMCYDHFMCREPVFGASHPLQRMEAPRDPGIPVHCSRHCLCKGVLDGKINDFHNLRELNVYALKKEDVQVKNNCYLRWHIIKISCIKTLLSLCSSSLHTLSLNFRFSLFVSYVFGCKQRLFSNCSVHSLKEMECIEI